jgi:hypothetical protein
MKQVKLKCNGTYQLVVNADDVNPLGINTYMNAMKKNKELLARKEAGLEVNVKNTECMLLTRHRN